MPYKWIAFVVIVELSVIIYIDLDKLKSDIQELIEDDSPLFQLRFLDDKNTSQQVMTVIYKWSGIS